MLIQLHHFKYAAKRQWKVFLPVGTPITSLLPHSIATVVTLYVMVSCMSSQTFTKDVHRKHCGDGNLFLPLDLNNNSFNAFLHLNLWVSETSQGHFGLCRSSSFSFFICISDHVFSLMPLHPSCKWKPYQKFKFCDKVCVPVIKLGLPGLCSHILLWYTYPSVSF